MGRVLTLIFQEWKELVLAPAFLLMGSLFLLLQSFLFFLVLQEFLRRPQLVRPTLAWLQMFWMGALLLVPPLTMRSVAEERAMGTLDVLLSTSMEPFAILFSKFCALLIHYLTLWMGCLAIQNLAQRFFPTPLPFPFFTAGEMGNIFLFLLFTGGLYIAMGIFFSTLAPQPIAGGCCTFVALIFALFGPRLLGTSPLFQPFPRWQKIFSYHGVCTPFYEFSNGIWDSRTIIFHCTATFLFLALGSLFLRRL